MFLFQNDIGSATSTFNYTINKNTFSYIKNLSSQLQALKEVYPQSLYSKNAHFRFRRHVNPYSSISPKLRGLYEISKVINNLWYVSNINNINSQIYINKWYM